MPYNIEEEEGYLKNNAPYKMDDALWRAMQERIKSKVLAAADKPAAKKIKFTYWRITAAAVGLLFITGICFTYWPAQKTVQSDNNIAYNKAGNPEKQLDAAITSLNESELNWVHQLNENEITEQNEYIEN